MEEREASLYYLIDLFVKLQSLFFACGETEGASGLR